MTRTSVFTFPFNCAWIVIATMLGSSPSTLAAPGYSSAGSVIGDDVLYSIGGGNAVSMGRAGNMQSIGVGIGWNSNLMCGNMDLSTTLHNQLNGLTGGFQSIMGSVIQNATGAVASLPALTHSTCRSRPIQPAHQRHSSGSSRLRSLQGKLPCNGRTYGKHCR